MEPGDAELAKQTLGFWEDPGNEELGDCGWMWERRTSMPNEIGFWEGVEDAR